MLLVSLAMALRPMVRRPLIVLRSQSRAPCQTVHGATEVSVDHAVQHEVEGEVDALQQVSDRLRRVEDAHVVDIDDRRALHEEIQQFRGNEEQDEKRNDDNEGKGDATCRVVVTVFVIAGSGSNGPLSSRH